VGAGGRVDPTGERGAAAVAGPATVDGERRRALGTMRGLRSLGQANVSVPREERRPVGSGSNSGVVERPPIIIWSDLVWVVFIVAGIGFLFCVAVLIGLALTALSLVWGAVVAFAVVVLVAALLLALELRGFWARLPR
jgi:hypothetical protein